MRGSLVSVSRSFIYTVQQTEAVPLEYHGHRIALVAVTSFCMIFYVGAYMGFGPMQLLLEKDGAFSRACIDPLLDMSCDAQSRALETVKFATTTFAQLSIPIFVMILDQYGPYVLHFVLSIMGCVGVLCILISSWLQFPELLYVAFGLIGSLAIASNLVMMEVASLFSDESSRRRVIALLSCLTDVGAGFGYWILWAAMANAGLSFDTVMGLYFMVGCVVYLIGTYLWTVLIKAKKNSEVNRIDLYHHLEKLLDDDCHRISNADSIERPLAERESIVHQYNGANNFHALPTVDEDAPLNEGSPLVSKPIRDKTLRSTFLQQALSSPFIILAGLYSFHDARIAFVSTTSRDFLGSLGDDATGFRYLTIFSLTAPLSLLGLPLVDLFIEKKGYMFAIQMVNLFAMVHGLILIGTTNLNIQVLGFILFSLYRCIAYAILLNYLEVTAKKHVLGKLTGVLSVVPAISNLMNIPISHWALGPLHGDFFWPNCMYTAATLLCVVAVIYLGQIS